MTESSASRKDDDLFPLRCPRCLHTFKEKVGWIKERSEIRCPGQWCGITLRYEKTQFLRALGQMRRGVYDFSGSFLTPDESS